MNADLPLKVVAITERIDKLISLAKEIKNEKSFSILDMYNFDGLQERFDDIADRERRLDNLALSLLSGAASCTTSSKPKLTDIELAIEKLRRILTSLTNYFLSRIAFDFKSMFRAKVPLLFKNLDDAHITNQIFNMLNFEFSYNLIIIQRGTRIYT